MYDVARGAASIEITISGVEDRRMAAAKVNIMVFQQPQVLIEPVGFLDLLVWPVDDAVLLH